MLDIARLATATIHATLPSAGQTFQLIDHRLEPLRLSGIVKAALSLHLGIGCLADCVRLFLKLGFKVLGKLPLVG